MRERNRTERNWHTAEPLNQPAEGVSQDGAEDGFLADESGRRADTEPFHDELPPGSGYGLGGERDHDHGNGHEEHRIVLAALSVHTPSILSHQSRRVCRVDSGRLRFRLASG